LPRIIDCAGEIGVTLPELFGRPIPITGLAGDQQAASIGQACLSAGDTKATYGTGAFILTNTGEHQRASDHRLLSTIAWQLGGVRNYALEGSVFVAGSLIKWLRDELGLIAGSADTEALARSVESSGGVTIVPGHSGLGAPYWEPTARGSISGLSFSTGRAHIVRAALEAMAHQTHDLMTAFADDGAQWDVLKIDGGMAANDWLAQDLADVTGLIVERPSFVETTALGAAMLAGLGCGLFSSLEDAAGMRGKVRCFEPDMPDNERQARLGNWRAAIRAALRH
jgi:glycerol kinase